MTAFTFSERITQMLDRVDERARTMSPVRLVRGALIGAVVAFAFCAGLVVRVATRGFSASKRWVVAACAEGYQAGRGKQS